MGNLTSVLSALRKTGLLLEQDKALPNVVTAITGESLAAFWWSHPRAADIYAAWTERRAASRKRRAP